MRRERKGEGDRGVEAAKERRWRWYWGFGWV